ncbi:hypothetical protein G6F61_014185 [Rhizopus arrhizus]|nr:hypothetical protein G6F61_014185 [Rhizopus arrhizus]
MLLQADHGVDRQRHRGLCNGRIALAERTEQGQAEGGQRQRADEDPRPREQPDHRRRGDAEAQHAGDDAQENAGQGGQRIQLPARGPRCRAGDEHPQAVTGLLVGPQAAETGLSGGHAGSVEGSATIIAGCA